MAATLTQRWEESLWDRVARIVAKPPVVERPTNLRDAKKKQIQRRLSAEQMDQVVADYVTGLSSVVVGRRYGINPSTVLENVRARGIERRPRSSAIIVGPKLERAIQLREEGCTQENIGNEFGVSRDAVRRALGRPRDQRSREA